MLDSAEELFSYIKSHDIKFIDFRFTDSLGGSHHITRHVSTLTEDIFQQGIAFDGSSIKGWKSIERSDMLIVPDLSTTFNDPFTAQNTLVVFCNVIDTDNNSPYTRDPRATAQNAVNYMQASGIADKAYFGLEVEFFIFDSARFAVKTNSLLVELDSLEGPYNSDRKYEYGNHGHRPMSKGGYAPVQPVDGLHDIRSEILETLSSIGMKPLLHHHEVTPSQCEIGFEYDELLKTADNLQKCKYTIFNVVSSYGKTATFMPKPISHDNGSGMHCHQSLWKDGKNLFATDKGNEISDICRYYIGGIIKHGQAINAFTNPTTNSYRRLIPGYEAPINLAYSSYNRSAAIRIPFIASNSPNATRIEARFPDPSANPYYCNASQLMAGLDGIKNKIDPGAAINENLYKVKHSNIPTVALSLQAALQALDADRKFLTAGNVFTDEQIDAYIALKQDEIDFVNQCPHPAEFIKYYST